MASHLFYNYEHWNVPTLIHFNSQLLDTSTYMPSHGGLGTFTVQQSPVGGLPAAARIAAGSLGVPQLPATAEHRPYCTFFVYLQ